ncbi:MAG: hypothetical protein JXM73_18740 [Anaerolineae bacterium]|nr:hypothetical protein [Anaerolineae bacterium]
MRLLLARQPVPSLRRYRDEKQLKTETPALAAQVSVQQLQMSARAYHRARSVKLARTIADPSASLRTGLEKAIRYRPRRQS